MKRKKYKKTHRVNQVKIEFTNKPITAWGGLGCLVGKFLEQIDFRSWVESRFPIQESSNNAQGIYEKVLAQFLTVLVGGSRFDHLSWWGHGVEAIRKVFGVEWLPKASSTLTRFWSKMDSARQGEQMGNCTRQFARQRVHLEGIEEDNLNLDSSVLTRYGQQEGARKGYHPKKPGRPSHHPLLAFLGSGYVINLWNRRGDCHTAHRVVAFFRQTIETLSSTFRVKRVLCDSGFYGIDFIEYLEGESYSYIMAAPMWPVLQQQVYKVSQWRKIEAGIEVGEFHFAHADAKWTGPRRYVVVRQEVRKRPRAAGKQPSLFKELEDWKEYRFSLMITNDVDSAPETIWREYRPRANDENLLKDLKEGYGFAAFSLRSFWATEAVMRMNALVFHNLVHYLNRNILNVRKAQPQLKTLRSKYLILPAQLGNSAGSYVLRLAVKDRSLRAQIFYFLEQIGRLSPGLNCNAVET